LVVNLAIQCKVLFVCMGNICRSPTAHAVFQKLVNENDLGDVIKVDSAGTDFVKFHYILVMDSENYNNLNNTSEHCHAKKIKFFLEFASQVANHDVPDPYYGGEEGFEKVLDLVENASQGLLEHIKQAHL